MKLLHFGCGRNKLAAWDNFDREVDIRKALPFPDGAAAFIYAEHVIEHVTAPEAVRFLSECKRVLQVGGVLRLAFPDATRIAALNGEAVNVYAAMLEQKKVMVGATRADCVRSVFVEWEHQSAWTFELMQAALYGVGLSSRGLCSYGRSAFPALDGIEARHADSGMAARLETTIVEAVRV